LAIALLFLGCSSKSEDNKNVEAKLVVGKSLENLKLNDQNEKPQTLPADTKVVFFSFSKPVGHKCNKFLESKPANYIKEHNAVYVADVSPAPSLIKKMFILPDLKELKFPILLINDDKLSAEYTKGINKDSIIIVELKDLKITAIKEAKDTKELEKILNK
jgi:hypothetical protein